MSLWIVRMVEEPFHRDTDDRPLRESRTPAEYLRPGEIQHKRCPYSGSRFQHAYPMNVAALRQTSAQWSDLVDAMALLRGLHAERRGPAPPDLMDLWRISQLGSALPWFYLLRHDGAERSPGYAAALAKATQGVGIWAQKLLVEVVLGATPPATFTAATLLESAEASGTLIGATEVCAGSESMLRRFFDALLDGEPGITSPAIQRLAAERDDVLRFGAHYASFKLVLWIHALARQFLYADLIHALGDHPRVAELRGLLDAGNDPPDFLMVRPPDPAAVPLPLRAAWLGGLAQQVISIAPDHSDLPLRAAALAIAVAAAGSDAPPDLVDELAAVTGLAAAAAAPAARALATFARLDAILGDVATTVEAGLRACDRTAAPAPPIDAAARDRLLVAPPRATLLRLAPSLASRCPA